MSLIDVLTNQKPEGVEIEPGIYETDHKEKPFSVHIDDKHLRFSDINKARTTYDAAKRNKAREMSTKYDAYHRGMNYSNPDKHFILRYSSKLGDLNHKLNNGKELDSKESDLVKGMDNLISKNSLPADEILWRGLNHNHTENVKNNDVINHPAFISTSTSPRAAIDFAKKNGGGILKIKYPAGKNVAILNSDSEYPGEYEGVLPRGLTLKIDHSKDGGYLYHEGVKYHVYHAEVI